VCVDSTEEGIGTQTTTQVGIAAPTEEPVENSKIDESSDIMDLERRDFEDHQGIEEELE
jgi:hypothetical protein